MGNTTISWTNKTWNPTRGCSRVSAGCTRCYAERQAARFAKGDLDNKNNGDQPFHSFAIKVNGHAAWTGKVELIESKLLEPLSWKTPARIFVNSMSDLFHEELPDEVIDRVLAVAALCPQHTLQVLTKRPGRMYRYLASTYSHRRAQVIGQIINIQDRFKSVKRNNLLLPEWPLSNVHLGVSVEDQKTADERIPLLLQTPAAKRFVSYEPALGPVNFEPYICPDYRDGTPKALARLDQIIVGGESGPGARPFDIAWPRQTLTQCRAANVAFFMKQFGADPREGNANGCCRNVDCTHPDCGYMRVRLKDRKGADISEWPEDLRVREFI